MSSNGGLREMRGLEPSGPGSKVTRLELFYDLVFVYAFLNVTTYAARRLTLETLVASLLVLALLWWAWSTFALIGNVIRTDQGIMPVVAFSIIAAVFVVALTLPEAFTDQPPGLPGDTVFAAGYLLVRALEVLASWYILRRDPKLRRRWVVLALPPLATTALLVIAAIVPQRVFHTHTAELTARAVLWIPAIAIAYVAGALIRTESLTIVSAGHWADRHAQIVLIALGETIISLGTGPNLQAGLPLTWNIMFASVLGIALIAALWWAYFDSLAISGEQALHRAQGKARVRLAREAYTYLHLPMIAGIILFSLGVKRTLADIARPVAERPESISVIDLVVLYGGVILYWLGLLAFQLRTIRVVDWFQVFAVVVLLVLAPIADHMRPFGALALLVASSVGVVVVHAVRSRHPRGQVRRRKLEEQRALEAEETEWRRAHG